MQKSCRKVSKNIGVNQNRHTPIKFIEFTLTSTNLRKLKYAIGLISYQLTTKAERFNGPLCLPTVKNNSHTIFSQQFHFYGTQPLIQKILTTIYPGIETQVFEKNTVTMFGSGKKQNILLHKKKVLKKKRRMREKLELQEEQLLFTSHVQKLLDQNATAFPKAKKQKTQSNRIEKKVSDLPPVEYGTEKKKMHFLSAREQIKYRELEDQTQFHATREHFSHEFRLLHQQKMSE